MNTETHCLIIANIEVEVVRKDIKNLHLGVYPPLGRVRVAVPLVIDDEAVRLAVIAKLSWIKRQRQSFADQDRQSSREMVDGESHWYQGRRYRLVVKERKGRPSVRVRGMRSLELNVRPGTSPEARQAVLDVWYRHQLKAQIPALLELWEPRLGVHVEGWGIKRMKTKWGSCNTQARRIWLNLELAKKPSECLEYVVVHELVHLLERHHNERFREALAKALPRWQHTRAVLNALPLALGSWGEARE